MDTESANLFAEVVLNIAYVCFIVALAAALLLPLIQIAKNPKSFVGGAIGLAVVAVIFAIGYGFATDEVSVEYATKFALTPSRSKFIGGLLNTTYIMIIVSFFGILISNIRNVFK